MLRIIGFLTGTALTVIVMLAIAGNVDGSGAQDALNGMLARPSSDLKTDSQTDSQTDSKTDSKTDLQDSAAEAAMGNESAASGPYSARAVLQNIADAQTKRLASEASKSSKPVVGMNEDEQPNDPQPAQQPHLPVVSAAEEIHDENDSSKMAGENATVLNVAIDNRTETGAWHAFWTPFRSEASAQGFATRLGRDTNRGYRVIRTAAGEYRVAFFHTDDNDRRARLVEIEQVSGLVLGGGEL